MAKKKAIVCPKRPPLHPSEEFSTLRNHLPTPHSPIYRKLRCCTSKDDSRNIFSPNNIDNNIVRSRVITLIILPFPVLLLSMFKRLCHFLNFLHFFKMFVLLCFSRLWFLHLSLILPWVFCSTFHFEGVHIRALLINAEIWYGKIALILTTPFLFNSSH